MSVDRLNRMTRDARHSVVVKWPFDMRSLRQRAGEKRCRVMTRLAMAGEFNSFLRLQILDVLLIERLAKRVAVRRLPPLRVRICVTSGAALGRHKHFSGNERAGGRGCVAWRERIRTEFEVIGSRYLARVGILVAVIVGICRSVPASCESQHGQSKQNQTCESCYRSPALVRDGLRIISFDQEHF